MVILGLGSNLGERFDYLGAAVWKLSFLLRGMEVSSIFESSALLPPDATPDMDIPFLNMAVRGETRLAPQALLAEIKNIEQELGRQERCVWAPREIDIDILMMDDLAVATGALTIPHPELLNRDFALMPLAELAPDWRYPVPGPFFQMTPKDIIAAKGYMLGSRLRETEFALHG